MSKINYMQKKSVKFGYLFLFTTGLKDYMEQYPLNTHIKPRDQMSDVAHGPLVNRVIFASFGWNWWRGSGEEDEKV